MSDATPLFAIANRKSKTCPERAKRVEWIENIAVPGVQRIRAEGSYIKNAMRYSTSTETKRNYLDTSWK